MSPEPRLLRVLDVEDFLLTQTLFAVRGAFGASIDAIEPLSGESNVVVGAGRPIGFGPFWIELWSPCDGHFPSIRFESWDARPPPVSTTSWESSVEGEIRVHERELYLQVVTMGFHRQSFSVGHEVHRVQVSVTGQAELPKRQADHLAARTVETADDLPHGLEHWLIQVWPG